MLSSVLNCEHAIEVNIAIIRAFVQLRKMMISHTKLAHKLADQERQMKDHDEQIQAIFVAIRQLMLPPERSTKKIGFEVKEAGTAISVFFLVVIMGMITLFYSI